MENLIGTKDGSALVFMREFEDGQIKSVKYDFADDSFYNATSKGNWRKVESVSSFFKKVSANAVINSFIDVKYRQFLETVVSASPSRLSNVASMLEYVSHLQHLETYILTDTKFEIPHIYKRRATYCNTDTTPSISGITKPVSFYQKEVLAFMRELDKTITFKFESAYGTHTQLFVNLCTYVRKEYHMDLQVYDWAYGLLINRDYTFRPFQELITNYNLEYKTCFSYLVEVDRREALDFNEAINYHRDYISMNRQMNNERAMRYPDNLTMRHNITARNNRLRVSNYNTDIFKGAINYNLDWMDKDFAVVSPLTPEELKEEGNKLHHCVASYIRKVMDGHCQIMFLRDLADGNAPLVTLEIRGNAIVQVRGNNNRYATDEEVAVLLKFAKAKRIAYKDYDPAKDIEADRKGEENLGKELDKPA
jgi:hypothetical protein